MLLYMNLAEKIDSLNQHNIHLKNYDPINFIFNENTNEVFISNFFIFTN